MEKRVREYMDESEAINTMMKQLLNGGSYLELIEKAGVLKEKMLESIENSQGKYTNLRARIEAKEGPETNYHKLQEKKKEIISKDQAKVDQYEDLAKSRLDTIKFKTLKKVKHTSDVEILFRFFYVCLYFEKPEEYRYSQFVGIALKKGVKEFKKRLAQFSVIGIGSEGLSMLEDARRLDYTTNKNNQDLMELLEWLDYKYEAYLYELTLRKHLEISNSLMANKHYQKDESEGLKILASDHQILIHSLHQKVDTITKIIGIMRAAEEKGADQRADTEEDFDKAQFKVEKIQANEDIFRIKRL